MAITQPEALDVSLLDPHTITRPAVTGTTIVTAGGGVDGPTPMAVKVEGDLMELANAVPVTDTHQADLEVLAGLVQQGLHLLTHLARGLIQHSTQEMVSSCFTTLLLPFYLYALNLCRVELSACLFYCGSRVTQKANFLHMHLSRIIKFCYSLYLYCIMKFVYIYIACIMALKT